VAGVPTYSTTVGSASDDVVLKFEVRVEDGGVELRLAVEAVADALPVGCGFGHGDYRCASRVVGGMVGLCYGTR